MAIQSSFKNMVLCLFTICAVCSALLAGVYALTKEPIEAAAQKKVSNSISKVVPEFDGEPVLATIEVGGKSYEYYTVSKGGNVSGYAVKAAASGFGGPVALMVGITPDGIIYNTSVLSQNETPGLGAKCSDESEGGFAAQFRNYNPAERTMKVTKDGGDIDAISASTITSRAYIAAVETALSVYKEITSK